MLQRKQVLVRWNLLEYDQKGAESKSPSLARAVEEVMSKETDETWFKSFVKSWRLTLKFDSDHTWLGRWNPSWCSQTSFFQLQPYDLLKLMLFHYYQIPKLKYHLGSGFSLGSHLWYCIVPCLKIEKSFQNKFRHPWLYLWLHHRLSMSSSRYPLYHQLVAEWFLPTHQHIKLGILPKKIKYGARQAHTKRRGASEQLYLHQLENNLS